MDWEFQRVKWENFRNWSEWGAGYRNKQAQSTVMNTKKGVSWKSGTSPSPEKQEPGAGGFPGSVGKNPSASAEDAGPGFLVREDPPHWGATQPGRHNYWAEMPKLRAPACFAREATARSPCRQNWRAAPTRRSPTKALTATKTQHCQKVKNKRVKRTKGLVQRALKNEIHV